MSALGGSLIGSGLSGGPNGLSPDPLSSSIGPGGLSSMANIGQMAPLSFASNPFGSVQAAMQGMTNLPATQPTPVELIDPNLMSEV